MGILFNMASFCSVVNLSVISVVCSANEYSDINVADVTAGSLFLFLLIEIVAARAAAQ